MSRECEVCGKKTVSAVQRKKLMSRYNPTPKKKKYPNLQKISVPEKVSKSFKDFAGKRIKACTRCIKSISKK
jgi:ribosomal protein L28